MTVTTIERQNLMYILSVYFLDCCTFSILNKGYSTHIIRSYGKYRSVNLVSLYVVSSPYDGKNENVLGRSSVLHFFLFTARSMSLTYFEGMNLSLAQSY